MLSSRLMDLIVNIPKAENHIHQDGATSPESALYLAERHGMTLPFSTPEEAAQRFQYRNLGDFIRMIDATNAVIQDEEDIAYLVTELGRDAATQNIRYREVMLSCDFHERTGISLDAQMRGFIQGREAAKTQFGVEFACIPELDRTSPPERNLSLVNRLEPWRKDANIVAVGLDSAEAGYPAHRHKEAFRRARELGYYLTAHAGEAYGPVSIWDSLDEAGCGRIDHGVRAVEDPELVNRLARDHIFLTVCPLSNLALKVFPDMEHHSIKQLMDAGVHLVDVAAGENAEEQGAGDAAHAVGAPYFERIVEPEAFLHILGVVAYGGAHGADDDRGPRFHVPGAGGNGGEAGHGAD